MESANIVLTGKQQVELKTEPTPEAPEGGLVVQTRLSLISTGTETICYRSEMDDGSHWQGWVKYPFYLGYSSVGTVVELGRGTEGFDVGDRVFSTSNHRQYAAVGGGAVKIPEGAWFSTGRNWSSCTRPFHPVWIVCNVERSAAFCLHYHSPVLEGSIVAGFPFDGREAPGCNPPCIWGPANDER